MKHLTRVTLYFTLSILLLLSSCTGAKRNDARLSVSIAPLKYIVEKITCGDFPVEVIVPAGAAPESYSPSPRQLMDIGDSKLLFITGLLDMEKELTSNLGFGSEKVINLSKNIILRQNDSHSSSQHPHSHGTDPHIWMSPKQLKIMASNAYMAIKEVFPDSVKYDTAYLSLQKELDRADAYINKKIADSLVRSFIIYHPALTYYALDYSLQQLSLENEGKEPSAIHMQRIIESAKRNHISVILYQEEYAENVVQSASNDIGAIRVAINPLNEDIVSEIIRITDVITATR